jgi:hypothetical protein
LPEQQEEQQTAHQDVGASFGRHRDQSGLPALKAGPCHNAVLGREEPEQEQVHDQGLGQRHLRPRVDGFRDGEVAYEPMA